jgi:hypothetical protein
VGLDPSQEVGSAHIARWGANAATSRRHERHNTDLSPGTALVDNQWTARITVAGGLGWVRVTDTANGRGNDDGSSEGLLAHSVGDDANGGELQGGGSSSGCNGNPLLTVSFVKNKRRRSYFGWYVRIQKRWPKHQRRWFQPGR